VCGLSATLAVVASPAKAANGPTSQDWRVCTGEPSAAPDLVIRSCTAVIRSRQETKAKLAMAHYHRATAYRVEGYTDRAIQEYDQAIELDPGYVSAYNDRGTAYTQKAQPNRAIENFNQAIRLDPKLASAFNNRGTAYAIKGELEKAIQDYDQAIRLEPKYEPR
jgi:tetratricopeptide (TPR) repeat protein